MRMFTDVRQGLFQDAVNGGLNREGKEPLQVHQVHLPSYLGYLIGKVFDQIV